MPISYELDGLVLVGEEYTNPVRSAKHERLLARGAIIRNSLRRSDRGDTPHEDLHRLRAPT